MATQAKLIGTGAPVIIGDNSYDKYHHIVYFPEAFNFKKDINIAEIAVPGLNHPVIQYVSGSSFKFSVDLLLYGYDRNPPISVGPLITAMQSWVLTRPQGTVSMPGKVPNLVTVGFGPSFDSIDCFCTGIDIKVTMVREEDLEPIEAECHLEFTEYVNP